MSQERGARAGTGEGRPEEDPAPKTAGLPGARRLSEGLHDQQARRVRDPGQARRRGRKGNLLTQILIDILKNLLPSNSALKAAIVAGFQVSEVHKTTVDFIVEEIFKSAKYISYAVTSRPP